LKLFTIKKETVQSWSRYFILSLEALIADFTIKIKSPHIEVVATLALPKSCHLPNLDFHSFQVSFDKQLTGSTSRLQVNAPSGKIENKSKTFHVINSTNLELRAGDVSGYWSLSQKSFNIKVRAGGVNIDVYPLGVATEEYDMNFKTEVRGGGMTSEHIDGVGQGANEMS
jgi:hypothetical protein